MNLLSWHQIDSLRALPHLNDIMCICADVLTPSLASLLRPATSAPCYLCALQIESLDALPHLDEIIEASDAVMVARSDLGAQVPFENVPSIQVGAAAAAAVKLL